MVNRWVYIENIILCRMSVHSVSDDPDVECGDRKISYGRRGLSGQTSVLLNTT